MAVGFWLALRIQPRLAVGRKQRGQELLATLVAVVGAVPDRHQMALVDVELDAGKHGHPVPTPCLGKERVPREAVVIGDRDDRHSRVGVRLDQ
jgi:hypothetical protein